MQNKDALMQMILKELEEEYAACGYAEECEDFEIQEVMVPTRDGIGLRTFVYLPQSEEKVYPVILQRTCYPFWEFTMKKHGEALAARGFAFVYQFCRGQNGSEGDWAPNVHERNDGMDTIDWLRQQPWAGRIGVWGSSYGALIGWAMADAVEGKVSSMFLSVYGTDRFASAYEKGCFRQDVLTSWSMENAGFPVTADYLTSCRYMPQAQVDEALWGGRLDWYRDYILNEKEELPYWQSGFWHQLRHIPAQTTIPLCISSGWFDHHHGSTMKTWARLHPKAKAHSQLVVDGCSHFGHPCLEGKAQAQNNRDEIKRMLIWFDETLKKGELPDAGVRLYEIGADCWRSMASMEQAASGERSFYLTAQNGEKGLTAAKEEAKTPATVSYIYDPEHPVMTHGAEALLHTGGEIGSLKQPEPDWREDVKSFLSAPLDAPLTICGKMKVKLYVSSDCEDTAFTAKVMEVDADGNAYNIRSSITTIAADLPAETSYVPGTPVEVEVAMWDILYTLPAGSRLRVDISSSDFPQYHIHCNYRGNWATQTKMRRAHQTILCGEEFPSALLVPYIHYD